MSTTEWKIVPIAAKTPHGIMKSADVASSVFLITSKNETSCVK
jgi:hypothetical protein